LLSTSL